MNNTKVSLVLNNIDLILAENHCTFEEVEDIIDFLQKEINCQKRSINESSNNAFSRCNINSVEYRPNIALLFYGLTDTLRKIVPVKNRVKDVDPLQFKYTGVGQLLLEEGINNK